MLQFMPLSMGAQKWTARNGRTDDSGQQDGSLRWLESLKRSQSLTAREERRKEEIMEIFRELYDISLRHQDPSVFPPWRPSW